MEQKKYIPNITELDIKRVVIVGGGFAGLKLVRKLLKQNFQIVLLDKNNFHQFQPLLYQVATAELEPSAISFPLRKILQKEKNIHFRIAEVSEIFTEKNEIETNIGFIKYDYLVLAIGAETNFFGQKKTQQNAFPMKSITDALLIRNTILVNLELALQQTSPDKRDEYLNIILVGGGPTGVELAGALAEMKNSIFPDDYPELDLSRMRIIIFEGSLRLLSGMSESASNHAVKFLEKLGVEAHLNTHVLDYDGTTLKISDGTTVASKTVVWAAGVKANSVKGLPSEVFGRGNRLIVDRANKIMGFNNVFAIGDLCVMATPKYPNGHPQVAQAAIQQAKVLSTNFKNMTKGNLLQDFEYKDKGVLATVGRNQALADLPRLKIHGFTGWVLWGVVHLFTIVGVKNRVFVFFNWLWNYFTHDRSLRLLIMPKTHENGQ